MTVTPALWDFGLTPEQGLKIAGVLTNWAMIDNEIGHLLERTKIITAGSAHKERFVDKIKALKRGLKRKQLPDTLGALIEEMASVASAYYETRNMLAHSILSSNPTRSMAWSQAKLKAIDLGGLDSILAESNYATWVSHNLFLSHLGTTPDPLPPRPPTRTPPSWVKDIRWN